MLGVTAVAVATGVVGSALAFSPHSVDAWWSACRRFLIPDLAAPELAVIAVVGLAIAVSMRSVSSIVRQLLGARTYCRDLPIAGRIQIDGGPIELIDCAELRAFCAGYLRPRVYISTGALRRLSTEEFRAVLAHERHHAVRRDPLRLLVARTLADALFFLPALGRIAERYADVA